jgi:hypothetical protein
LLSSNRMREFDTASQILIGKTGADHVAIDITNRSEAEPWLEGNLEIMAGSWRGRFRVWFHQGELRQFASDIEWLYSHLASSVELHPLEPYIEVRLSGNGKGRIVLEGKARDLLSSGTYLVFELEMDQTELPAIAISLRAADPI